MNMTEQRYTILKDTYRYHCDKLIGLELKSTVYILQYMCRLNAVKFKQNKKLWTQIHDHFTYFIIWNICFLHILFYLC